LQVSKRKIFSPLKKGGRAWNTKLCEKAQGYQRTGGKKEISIPKKWKHLWDLKKKNMNHNMGGQRAAIRTVAFGGKSEEILHQHIPK